MLYSLMILALRGFLVSGVIASLSGPAFVLGYEGARFVLYGSLTGAALSLCVLGVALSRGIPEPS